MTKNYESILVVKEWLDQNDDTVSDLNARFDRLWDGTGNQNFVFVKDFNELIMKRLSEFSEGRVIVDKNVLTPNALVLYMQGSKLRIQNNLNSVELNYSSRPFRKLRSTRSEEHTSELQSRFDLVCR